MGYKVTFMARFVKHHHKKPARLKPSKDSVFICRCGLSKNWQGEGVPFCDGSHAVTQDEPESKVFLYDKKLNRREVSKLN